MSKYIDIDSLRKEIDHRIDILEDMSIKCAKNDDTEMHAYYHGKAMSLDELLLFIDSLQQEQPKSRLIQVKCIHPYDESWEKDKVYTCEVWHHSSLDIDFLDVYYDYKNNSNYVQFSSIEMLNKEFAIVQQEQPSKESLNESQQEFVDIVTERMLKEGPIPTLKGKQKAEFEKEFNRFKQIAGMINWPAYEEIYKKIILWFMAWGADNLPNLGKPIDPGRMDIQQEQPSLPNDLDEAAEEYMKKARKHLFDDSPIGRADDAFKAGAEWAMHYQEKKIADAYEKGKQEGIRVVRSWESSPGQCGY